MKSFLKWLNKKGITTDAFVVVLLVVGLAVAIMILAYFAFHGKDTTDALFNVSNTMKDSGVLK